MYPIAYLLRIHDVSCEKGEKMYLNTITRSNKNLKTERLFHLLQKTLSDRRYDSRRAFGSVIYQCLQGIPKMPTSCLYKMIFGI